MVLADAQAVALAEIFCPESCFIIAVGSCVIQAEVLAEAKALALLDVQRLALAKA